MSAVIRSFVSKTTSKAINVTRCRLIHSGADDGDGDDDDDVDGDSDGDGDGDRDGDGAGDGDKSEI